MVDPVFFTSSTDYEEFHDQTQWCNYDCHSKSNTYYRRVLPKGVKVVTIAGPFYQKDTEKEKKLSISVREESKIKIVSLIPNENVVSPWLKFGLKKDPWHELEHEKLPEFAYPPFYAKGPLTSEIIASGISNFSQLPDTKAYCATNLVVKHRGLTDIKILFSFHCLQKIDISWNEITDLTPLDNMIYLMRLDASHNKITSAIQMKPPWYLTYISLACNEITTIQDLSEFWSLRYIDLSYNRIDKIHGLQNLKYLQYLNLSHNDITRVENVDNLDIDDLRLGYNKISSWESNSTGTLNVNPKIKFIDLSHNFLNSLVLFEGLEELRVLNISHNLITDIQEIDYLKNKKCLRKLSLKENAIASCRMYKLIVLVYLSDLTIIDGEEVTDLDREASKMLFTRDWPLRQYVHQAKLLLYDQLGTHPLITEAQPSGGKPFPVVALVGPVGAYKLQLAKRLSVEFSEFVNMAYNHVVRTPVSFTYGDVLDSTYVVTEEEFNKMLHGGEFLATSDSLGFTYGLSRAEFARSIEQGKLSIVTADLLMSFSLQALGLNPYLICAMVEDPEIHLERILEVCDDSVKESYTAFPGAIYADNNTMESVDKKSIDITHSSADDTEAKQFESEEEIKEVKELHKHSIDLVYGRPSFQEYVPYLDPGCRDNYSYTNDDVYKITMLDRIDPESESQQSVRKFHSADSKVSEKAIESYEREAGKCPFSGTSLEKEFDNFDTKSSIEGTTTSFNKISDGSSSDIIYKYDSTQFSFNSRESDLLLKYRNEIKTCDSPSSYAHSDEESLGCSSYGYKVNLPKSTPKKRLSIIYPTQKPLIRRDDTYYKWSWTSSIDSVGEQEESVPERVAYRTSSSSLSSRIINYISSKVIENRKVYFDYYESGYFPFLIYTDNLDQAYNKLKKEVCRIYNLSEDYYCKLFERDPLYEAVVAKRMMMLISELDETESTLN